MDFGSYHTITKEILKLIEQLLRLEISIEGQEKLDSWVAINECNQRIFLLLTEKDFSEEFLGISDALRIRSISKD